jgi:hypothetical protein
MHIKDVLDSFSMTHDNLIIIYHTSWYPTRCCRMNSFYFIRWSIYICTTKISKINLMWCTCKYYYDKIAMVNFNIHKYFTNIFTFMKRTREPHVIGLRMELHNIFCTPNRRRRNAHPIAWKGLRFFIQSPCWWICS